MLATARGHPQRAMLLAHFLWERTPRGGEGDEAGWQEALGDVYLELRDGLNYPIAAEFSASQRYSRI